MRTVRNHAFFGVGTLTFAAIAIGILTAHAIVRAQQGRATEGQVTFTKDVAPILYRSCVRCHRPGEIAPMSLISYSDARPWVQSIKQRVSRREMPPWFLDKTIGIQKYKNDPSLHDDEITTIVKWVDGGALQGNPADMPAMPNLDDMTTWRIGTPDLIVKYPAFKMPATGPDLYGTLTAAFGTKEDRYIKAIQSRVVDADSRQVVHHALSYAVEPGDESEMGDDAGGGSGQFLVEYASGKNATFAASDAGVLLRAGQNARVSYHFHSIGKGVQAKIELGIVLYPKGFVPKHVQWSKQLGQESAPEIDIPANSIVRRDGYTRLNSAAKITAWQPHM